MIYVGEKEFDADYSAERYDNGSIVYGIGVITIDEEKSYLIQKFEPNDAYADNNGNATLGLTSGVMVKTNSIIKLYKINNKTLTRKLNIGSIVYDDFK